MSRPGVFLGGLLLILLCSPVFLYRLGGPGLADPDEGRNAEVAREMAVAGDWVTPHINDARYLDKPPAFFWAVACSYLLFGFNEWAARLPSAICALAGIAVTFWFARRHLGEAAGWLAAGFLALSPLYIVFGRIVIFDMMLTLCMTASALAVYVAMEKEDGPPSRAACVVFFAAAGVGTIVKGPVALVVPALLALTWAFARKRPALLGRLLWGRGMLIFAAVVFPWLGLVSLRNPGFLRYALLGENIQRMSSNKFETGRPAWFYLTVLLPGLFPWILYPAAAAVMRLPGLLRRRAPAAPARFTAGPVSFAAVWLGVLVVFFSLIVSKRPSYVLPCAVPVALLAGHLWAAAFTEKTPGGARANLRAGSAVVALCCLALAFGCALLGPGGFRPEAINPRYAGILARAGLFGMTALGLVLATVVIGLGWRARRTGVLLAGAVLSFAVMVPLTRAVYGMIDSQRSSREISRLLSERLGPEDTVVSFEEYRPGLNFYLRRPIHQVTRAGRIFTSNYIAMHLEEYRGDPSFRLIPQDGLGTLYREAGGSVYILAPRKEYDALFKMIGTTLRPLYEDDVAGLFARPEGAG